MNRFKSALLIALFALAQLAYAQVPIQITELTPVDDDLGYNPDTLKSWIVNILRGRGGMIDTSTITFTGNYQALGRFYDGADIGFDKGLIISNGMVENAMAPNGTGSMSDIFNEPDHLSPIWRPSFMIDGEPLFGAHIITKYIGMEQLKKETQYLRERMFIKLAEPITDIRLLIIKG